METAFSIGNLRFAGLAFSFRFSAAWQRRQRRIGGHLGAERELRESINELDDERQRKRRDLR
ncbi:hypothetical protein D3C71_2102940 [compost metagenome]